MLGLDWSELALIAVVAVVVIGPKDLPDAVRGIAKGIQKLRRMAGEFQGHVDEVVREAKLEDVRNSINDIRNFNVRDIVEKEIDRDGSLRKTFTDDPFKDSGTHGAAVTPPPVMAAAPPVDMPSFIPPGTLPPMPAPPVPPDLSVPPAFLPPEAPAFVPPEPASAPVAPVAPVPAAPMTIGPQANLAPAAPVSPPTPAS